MKKLIPGQWIQAKCKQWFKILEIDGDIVKVAPEYNLNLVFKTHILELI